MKKHLTGPKPGFSDIKVSFLGNNIPKPLQSELISFTLSRTKNNEEAESLYKRVCKRLSKVDEKIIRTTSPKKLFIVALNLELAKRRIKG